jgi:hypothetical protein
MKKFSHPLLSILFIYVIFCLSISVNAQNAPERETKVLGDINPYEVILYHSHNYDKVIKSWKLAPGMRMLKIPQLDDVPFSILLGSKVSVILFPNYDFNSYTQKTSAYSTLNFGGYKEPTKKFLIPYFRFQSSKPLIDYVKDPPYRGSLIIHRKDIRDILGVHLQSGNYFGQFYPLPEKANDSAIIYHKIPHGGPFTLSIISGGDGWIATYPPTSHPNQYDIQITITSVNGAKRKLPGPNNKLVLFDLNKLGVRQISSLKLEYKGPLDEQVYLNLPPKKHRAPPASSAPVVSVIDKEDTLHQSTMSPARTFEHGNSGKEISKAGTGSMTASPGKAPKPQGVTPAPIPNVSGQWKSNIGVVYDMTQNGDNFEWTVKAKNEIGNGFIKGSNISASWKSPFGSGASNGKITTVDSAGKATKIQWYNGVQFYR